MSCCVHKSEQESYLICRRRKEGSSVLPFFLSFKVKWRCGPVEREPLLPVIPMGVPGLTWEPLVTRDWERWQ